MTFRYQIYLDLLKQQDHVAVIVALISLGVVLGYMALAWLDWSPIIQAWTRRIYLFTLMAAYMTTLIMAAKG